MNSLGLPWPSLASDPIPTRSWPTKPMKNLTWKIIREIANSWPVYLFCAIFIVHVLGIRIYSYMNLWPKATKLYTIKEINIIPTAGYRLQIFCETRVGALIITWINEICSYSADHGAIIIDVVETAAFTFQAWVPLLIYNTGEAPRFRTGYQMSSALFALEIVFTSVVLYCSKRWPQGARPERPRGEVEDEDTSHMV